MRDLVRARLDRVWMRCTHCAGTPTALGVYIAPGLPLRAAGLDQAASSAARGSGFEQAVHHIVLEDYVQAVEAAEARRGRLTAQIEAMLPDWTLAPVVAGLQTMRGMALVNAATLIAELGDLSRFAIHAS
jgi:transposase